MAVVAVEPVALAALVEPAVRERAVIRRVVGDAVDRVPPRPEVAVVAVEPVALAALVEPAPPEGSGALVEPVGPAVGAGRPAGLDQRAVGVGVVPDAVDRVPPRPEVAVVAVEPVALAALVEPAVRERSAVLIEIVIFRTDFLPTANRDPVIPEPEDFTVNRPPIINNVRVAFVPVPFSAFLNPLPTCEPILLCNGPGISDSHLLKTPFARKQGGVVRIINKTMFYQKRRDSIFSAISDDSQAVGIAAIRIIKTAVFTILITSRR